jgi:LAO/AO transport system kinase
MIKDHDENSWIPKIIKTVASDNKNISDVAAEIENHKTFMKEKNLFSSKREKQARLRIKEIVEQKLKDKLWGETGENSLNSILNRVVLENLSPYKVADDIILEFKNRL